MATLTEHSGVSASQLSRLFRSAGASAPMAYVTEVRMAQARALLTETDLPIGQIARAVGYPDPYHFSRRFAATTWTRADGVPARVDAAAERAAAGRSG